MQAAWAKYGAGSFRFQIVETCPVEVLIDREQAAIDAEAPRYNVGPCAANPMTGAQHTAEALARMSENRRGKGCGPRVISEAHRAALSAAARRRHPAPTVDPAWAALSKGEKVSAKLRAKWADADYKERRRQQVVGENNPAFGQPAWNRGMTFPETHGGNSPNAKPICVGDQYFPSQAEAAAHFGVARSLITYWLKRGKASFA
jgi:hypothetical protein